MHTSAILSRLGKLNEQLEEISKLKKMGDDSKVNLHTNYKKFGIENNNRKPCRCSHHLLSLEEEHIRYTWPGDYFPNNICKNTKPCNMKTCKTRRPCCCRKILGKDFKKEEPNYPTTLEAVSENRIQRVDRNINHNNTVMVDEKENKAEQRHLDSLSSKIRSSDKAIGTNQDKDTGSIPTRDTNHQAMINDNNNNQNGRSISKNSSEVKSTSEMRKSENFINTSSDTSHLEESLSNERKRSKELEEKLNTLTSDLNCLLEECEHKTACLKETEERARLASVSKDLALSLAEQSKGQTDVFKNERDNFLSETISLQKELDDVTRRNNVLTQERDELRTKLENLSENEAKMYLEVQEEVNKIKLALKEKEEVLEEKREEFMGMISELTNVVMIQKARISELTNMCNCQQELLKQKDKELSENSNELHKTQNALQTNNQKVKEMEAEVEHLKYCLCEEKKASEFIKGDMKQMKENHSSELRIKEKMVEEQNKTIARQKKLLQDSEKMADQTAREFEQLKGEIHRERQRSYSLQLALDELDERLNNSQSSECPNCPILQNEIENATIQKQKAVATAKLAVQKFSQSTRKYQQQFASEKNQQKMLLLMLKKKQEEVRHLKMEAYHARGAAVNSMDDYIM